MCATIVPSIRNKTHCHTISNINIILLRANISMRSMMIFTVMDVLNNIMLVCYELPFEKILCILPIASSGFKAIARMKSQ